MPIHNAEIADIFYKYADLLEISGANEFRVRAYRTAARNLGNMSHSIANMVTEGQNLTELPGVGKELAGKIDEIVKTGKLTPLEDIKKTIPTELITIMEIAGLGPKRANKLHGELGITSIKELETAARAHKIHELAGFGEKIEQAVLEDIERKGEARGEPKRFKLSVAGEVASPLLAYLRKSKGVKQVEVAGSYRRRMETVGDLDILAAIDKNSDVMERFVKYEDVEKVISKGTTRSTVELRFGVQVDVRAVPEESYGAALHYFTGSKAHNIAIRLMGVKAGLKINEYGVFKEDKFIAGKTEEEVYRQVKLPYIEPELRENRGEIEAAKNGTLPKLIQLSDIKGDFHSHTNATEGKATVEEMAKAAQAKGYEYLAITDHSKHLAMTKGLDKKRLTEQIKEIDRLNAKTDKFTILKSIEVDVLEDGSLDLEDEILKELDLVVCSMHYRLNLSLEHQTQRIITALTKSPVFTILGHPTGRIIGERDPYEVDVEKVLKTARETGCAVELNAQPERLDLNDIYCKMAKEMGVLVAISTDSHSTNELDFMRFGIDVARRGWLEPENVLNTRKFTELKKLLKKK